MTNKNTIKLMTFNAGEWYNGIDKYIPRDRYDFFLEMHKEILEAETPDILCVQEHVKFMSPEKNTEHKLLNKYFKYNYAAKDEQMYTGKCISSNLEIYHAENHDFKARRRNYSRCYFNVDNKKILLVNAHLSLKKPEIEEEISELLAIVKKEKYFIICGDFNIGAHSIDDTNYDIAYKQFLDLGYHLANGSEFGFIDSYFSSHNPPAALDQVVTSSNITIKEAHVNTIKFDKQIEECKDHLPFIVTLEIN